MINAGIYGNGIFITLKQKHSFALSLPFLSQSGLLSNQDERGPVEWVFAAGFADLGEGSHCFI
jgi:hypothetical protein